MGSPHNERRPTARARLSLLRDDSGFSVESILIGLLLLIILSVGAVFAYRWAQDTGNTTVARTNLEVAAQALAATHAAGLGGSSFDATMVNRAATAVPELTLTTVPTVNAAAIETLAGTNGGTVWWSATTGTPGTATRFGTSAATQWADLGDLIWLFTAAESGDQYCALVVAETDADAADLAGTWYETQAIDIGTTTDLTADCGRGASATGTLAGVTRAAVGGLSRTSVAP